jgi:hypothetical protein
MSDYAPLARLRPAQARKARPEGTALPDQRANALPRQLKDERTPGGMPGNLARGIESLSGISMNNVRVHYNSSKPASMQAHAYAQGSDIHLASGQEQHLAHEAWHVVQQAQGRVRPTTQVNGTAVNDSPALEREADRMGTRALKAGA